MKRENWNSKSNSKTLILKDILIIISVIKQLINAEWNQERDKVYNILPTAI